MGDEKKVQTYELAMEKFINILINVKVQIAINPEQAQKNIDDVINLLRRQKETFIKKQGLKKR